MAAPGEREGGPGSTHPDRTAGGAPEAPETKPDVARAAPEAPGAGPSVLPHGLGMDSGGLLYGTIVSAAALAVGATRGDTVGGMFETMVSTLLIYWLAHIYVATVNGPARAAPSRCTG